MSSFYWVLPDDAINYKGESLKNKVVEIKAKSKASATQTASNWRFDEGYQLYTANEKVPFVRFAFNNKLQVIDLKDASNLVRTYKYQLMQMETGEIKESDVSCLPSELFSACHQLIGNNTEPIDRYEFKGKVYTPPTGYYLFINTKRKEALMIQNHAKVYCSMPKASNDQEKRLLDYLCGKTREKSARITPSGVPVLEDVKKLFNHSLFEKMETSSNVFLNAYPEAVNGYEKLGWPKNPFQCWSRVWEYPYHANSIQIATNVFGREVKVADLGSGVTFFPWYLKDKYPNMSITMIDSDHRQAELVNKIIDRAPNSSGMKFRHANLQYCRDVDNFDIIYCVSVLEHLSAPDGWSEILLNINQMLAPGGFFIISFDVDLSGKGLLDPKSADKLLYALREIFREVCCTNKQCSFERMASVINLPEFKLFTSRTNPRTGGDSENHCNSDLTISCHVFKKRATH